jgi:two-component system LytT family sensor kinase
MRGSIACSFTERHTIACRNPAAGCKIRLSSRSWHTIQHMDARRTRKEMPQWFWIAAIFAGAGLFDATQNVFVMRAEGMHHYWARLFATLFFSWLPWMLATPLVLSLSRSFPPSQWKKASTWIAHLIACVGIGLIYAMWVAVWELVLNPWAYPSGSGPFSQLWLHKFYGGLLSYVVLYGMILLIGNILRTREEFALQQTETARLNEQLSKAQLNALRRQIEPHFLFNTLNAIAGLVRENRNDAAVSMIAELSDFLRRVVKDSDRQQVPLAEELEFAHKYLDIQKARFAERLQFTVDVPAELLCAQVPSLILQPMVENAVKHGIAKRLQGGAIRIAASRSNGTLTLRVYNDGPSLPPDWEKSQTGIGMANVETRLQGLYGKAFHLSMCNRAPGGVETSISVPFVATELQRRDDAIDPTSSAELVNSGRASS